jgi:transcriptional/translational regulatory protein YebC/TACO1
VAFLFDRLGVVVVEGDADEDELMLVAAEAGADDIADDEGVWQVTSEPTAFAQVRAAVEEAGFAIASADIRMVPKSLGEVDEETARKLMRLVDALEDDDDVQEVFFNFEIPEALLTE